VLGIFRILALIADHRAIHVPSFLGHPQTIHKQLQTLSEEHVELIVTGRCGNRGSIPGRCRCVFFSTASGADLRSTQSPVRGAKLKTYIHLVPRFRMPGTTLPFAHTSSCHCSLFSIGTTLNLPFREPQMCNDQL
jgi:hypothetical protein